ncbi:hypothetical protein EVAR_76343_1 [Eumeta japonica]|uniref:Uncharacterized protein n=1 Tax=Eumeta variegata TaxID=151549 RepID=A0A4C1T7K9_EUMVA|nr:hypothetical protein EVAR_76343_1 [Eumeta japonica]
MHAYFVVANVCGLLSLIGRNFVRRRYHRIVQILFSFERGLGSALFNKSGGVVTSLIVGGWPQRDGGGRKGRPQKATRGLAVAAVAATCRLRMIVLYITHNGIPREMSVLTTYSKRIRYATIRRIDSCFRPQAVLAQSACTAYSELCKLSRLFVVQRQPRTARSRVSQRTNERTRRRPRGANAVKFPKLNLGPNQRRYLSSSKYLFSSTKMTGAGRVRGRLSRATEEMKLLSFVILLLEIEDTECGARNPLSASPARLNN